MKLLKFSIDRNLLKNFASLGIIQITNYLIPIITIPFLIYTLGLEKFGLIALAQAFMAYLMVISDYGFNLTATRTIVLHRVDNHKISEIFSAVMSTKILLLGFCFCLLGGLLWLSKELWKEKTLYFYSFFLVIGQAFFPIWFFQGIEKMQHITYINVVAKLSFLVLLFSLVRQPIDYELVNLFQGLGTCLASLLACGLAYSKYQVRFQFVSFKIIKQQLREGFNIFLVNFSIGFYLNTNIIVLNFLVSDKIIVGYYSLAEKLINLTRQLLSVFFQAIYPRVCRETANNFNQVKSTLDSFILPASLIMLVLCAFMFFASDMLVYFLSGTYNPNISILIKIMSFVPLIVLWNIPAYQILLAYNFSQVSTYVFIIASFINLFLNLILASYFAEIGTAITLLFTEIWITVSLHLALRIFYKPYSFINI